MGKSGKSLIILHFYSKVLMLNLLGEYNCKVDAKGRFMMPSALKKELAEVLSKGFVVNRNLHQKCLVLYPADEWVKISKKLNSLNRLIKKNDLLVRKIMGGATKVEVDGSGRLLVPKSLAQYADLGSELKVVGSGATMEIWDKSSYESIMDADINYEELAEDVMGDISFDDND